MRIRSTDAFDPSKSNELRVCCTHEAVAYDVDTMFIMILCDIWLGTQFFGEAWKHVRVFLEVVVFPECLETVELVGGF